MNADHVRLRGQVLVFEDLEPQERQEADAHLQVCADCRRVRNGLLAAESRRGTCPAWRRTSIR